MNRDTPLEDIKKLVKSTLDRLYDIDAELFKRKKKVMMHELCFTFRFGHHLQNLIGEDFFVDSQYDSSYKKRVDSEGNPVLDEDGNEIYDVQDQKYFDKIGGEEYKYVDIIVHRREKSSETDFICIELKKETNDTTKERANDFNKLEQLTSIYHYKYGFYLVLGKKIESCKWIIFRDGLILEPEAQVIN